MSRSVVISFVAFAFIAWNFVACATFAYPRESRHGMRNIRRLQRLPTQSPPSDSSDLPPTTAAGNASGGGGENTSDEAERLKQLEESAEGNKILNILQNLSSVNLDKVLEIQEKKNSTESMLQTRDDGNDDGSSQDVQIGDINEEKSKKEQAEDKDVMDMAAEIIPGLETMIPKIRKQIEKFFNITTEDLDEIHLGRTSEGMNRSNDALRDAVTAKNIFDLLANLKKDNVTEYNEVVKSPSLLLKKIMRDDLILDEEEYEQTHFGIDQARDRQKMERYINSDAAKKHEKDLQELVAQQLQGSQTQGNMAMLEMEADKCDITSPVCDRRFKPNSCESRIPVESQGYCSSCWAFSGAHSYAISQCMRTGEAVQFSKQELLDCSQSQCYGGMNEDVLRYIDRTHHWSSKKDYPYENKKGKCRAHDKPNVLKTLPDPSDYLFVTTARGGEAFKTEESWTNAIKALLVKHGAVVFYINATGFRHKGTTPIEHCEARGAQNHAMLLTGWKVNEADQRPVWIVRNSWGTGWAENGYGYLYMDTKCPEKGHFNFHIIAYPRYVKVFKNPLKPVILEKEAVYTRHFDLRKGPDPKGGALAAAFSCATIIRHSDRVT